LFAVVVDTEGGKMYVFWFPFSVLLFFCQLRFLWVFVECNWIAKAITRNLFI